MQHLTPANITSALAYMGWSTSDDMAAKVAVAVNHAGSVAQLTESLRGRFELSDVERAADQYAEALRLAADPVAAAEMLAFEAANADGNRDYFTTIALEFQGKADHRRTKGETSLADEFQARAHAALRAASEAAAVAKAKRERAERLTMVAA